MTLEQYLDRFAERDWQSTEDGTVRFALVGLGWWVREEVLPALEDTDLCTATVLVSGSAEKAESVADGADVAAGVDYEAFHDGAAADRYDAVYVCTPNAV
ncbi:glucose-fructose oxidoreductase, partial [Halobacteriales archaeon QS_1_68_44]